MSRAWLVPSVLAISLIALAGYRIAFERSPAAPVTAQTATVPTSGAAAAPPTMAGHGSVATPTIVEPIAAPAGGLSIAEVIAQRKALAGKAVTVRGQVVKANNGILGRNWIHLQDGSGSAADRTNDLTITSDAVVKVGDVVTFTGVLAVGVEIGEGYGYDALLEQAKVVK